MDIPGENINAGANFSMNWKLRKFAQLRHPLLIRGTKSRKVKIPGENINAAANCSMISKIGQLRYLYYCMEKVEKRRFQTAFKTQYPLTHKQLETPWETPGRRFINAVPESSMISKVCQLAHLHSAAQSTLTGCFSRKGTWI